MHPTRLRRPSPPFLLHRCPPYLEVEYSSDARGWRACAQQAILFFWMCIPMQRKLTRDENDRKHADSGTAQAELEPHSESTSTLIPHIIPYASANPDPPRTHQNLVEASRISNAAKNESRASFPKNHLSHQCAVQRSGIRDQSQHWKTTWKVPSSADPIPILWFSGFDHLGSDIVLRIALVLLTPTDVQLLRLRLTDDQKGTNLCHSRHREALETQWSANFDHLADVDLWIAPKEADCNELRNGTTISLEKCSIFIREIASAMNLPTNFKLEIFPHSQTRIRAGRRNLVGQRSRCL
ncbi:hypothetical protein BU23DRAFT_70807 [Bimuria novae-zelandiae CBS 107.79]|uniref:Uncharacterized protein n=1 Tax=Bimuria novae-zelandiae CBS 107.79 TaxID=1447943 RepID=A0A6A5UKB6_9PLEO|nr:hypothetical protein BU23DRAFT_70807 [Bimuria novae-zelandiae CBS 107.79]